MAQLTKEFVISNQLDFLTVKEFSEKYAGNVSSQAIYYAMNNGLVDWMAPARERFVVMTDRSKNYVPNDNVNRK